MFTLTSCVPGNPSVPSKSGHLVTLGENHLLCFPCVLPTPWYVVLLLRFLQMTPFCVCHLLLPRAPADTPGASGGWSCFQSLFPFRVRSNQMGCNAKRGEKEINLLHLYFSSENMPPSETNGDDDSRGSLPTYYGLLVVLRTLMHVVFNHYDNPLRIVQDEKTEA